MTWREVQAIEGSSYQGQNCSSYRPGFNRRSLRVHDFEDGKAPRQSLEILFYQNQCSSKLNYRCKLAFLRNVLLYPKVSSLSFSKDCHFGRPQFAFITDLLNDLNNDLGM